MQYITLLRDVFVVIACVLLLLYTSTTIACSGIATRANEVIETMHARDTL
jgi:hypothetical protein